MNKVRVFALALAMSLSATAGFAADGFDLAISLRDIDDANCQTFHDGKAAPAEIPAMCASLGFPRVQGTWSAGEVTEAWNRETFQYRVAFVNPVEIGSIVTSTGSVQFLKDDATYPGDPANPDHWLQPDVLPHQSGARLITLPVGFKTRAVLVTEERRRGASELAFLRLFKKRFTNITPLGFPNVDAEYTQYSSLHPPHTYFATDITQGKGAWVNAGKNEKGQNLRPPISDIDPSYFILSWKQEKTINGLWINDNFIQYQLQYYVGPDSVNPTVGSEKEWKKLDDITEKMAGGRWISFAPIKTRGIKILILKTHQPQSSRISGLHVFSDIGDAPVPTYQPPVEEQAPYRVPYDLPFDGKVSMVINNPDGTRVRNVIGLKQRLNGENAEYWDLKDEAGQFIETGEYQFVALAHPPLELRYEMTPYPNIIDNSPENSPWLNSKSGSGGWMADHTPPRTVSVIGDRVYFGATCPESGVSTIECDLTGTKLWGYHSFQAWTGPKFMAADDTNVYAAASAWGIGNDTTIDPNTDMIWAINAETKEVTQVATLPPTSRRKRGMQGMAAKDGKLYLSMDANAAWLVHAAGFVDVDIESCTPRYPKKRKPRYDHEIVPDPRGDFMRLFRLRGQPPGNHVSVLTVLKSTEGPSSKQHIVLAFNREVPIGSLVFPVPQNKDYKVKFSVLKDGGTYPPNAEDDTQWKPFEYNGENPWEVVPAPEGCKTRALRITFVKGADDIFTQVQDERMTGGGLGALVDPVDSGSEEESQAWHGELEGMMLLRRRFVNLSPKAKIRVNSGIVRKDGSWDANRPEDRPVTEADPGIYVQEWEKPQNIRGVALKEIDGKTTEIDVYVGPDDQPVDIEDDAKWKNVGTYHQERRDFYAGKESYNPNARYLDGYVDLGPNISTRAVRLRITEQWITQGHYPKGVRADFGGTTLDASRCRVHGMAAVQYAGGEVPVDKFICERIEVYDVAQQKVVQESYMAKPRYIEFDKKGNLFVLSNGVLMKVDLENDNHQPFITDLIKPTCFDFDADNNCYVFDAAPDRNVVRVYDAAGKFSHIIGTPGGYVAGPWTSTRLQDVTDLAVDPEKQIWIVEEHYWPKRISLWTLDGQFKREFLGNTAYGGGGVLDRYDKRRMYYGNLEFELDWETGKTRLKNLTCLNEARAPELSVETNGRRYMTTRIGTWGNEQPAGIVYLDKGDHVQLAAAVGAAEGFAPLLKPSVRKLMGSKGITAFRFMWSDLNNNGEVDPEEVTLAPKDGLKGLSSFNEDLGVQAANMRYVVKEFLPSGVPVYEEKYFPNVKGESLFRLNNGNFFKKAPMRGDLRQAGIAPDGKLVWTWDTEGSSGFALGWAKPLYDSQVVSEFGIIGHEVAPEGGLGEFVVLHSNVATWNIWTADGILAGRIFRDLRDPKAEPWSMKEHYRGLRLDDVCVGQEHCSGYFCRSRTDGKYYAVAGHNHASVVEVSGIEKFKRITGTITVTPEDLRKAQQYEIEHVDREVYKKANVIDCYRKKRSIRIDGNSGDWEYVNAVIDERAKFRVTYDDDYLYLCYETRGMGPMKNTGQQWDRLFKTGASVDLQMGVDPDADDGRKAPVVGDFRLLMTMVKGEPRAVIYRPVVPGTPEENVWKVISPVNRAYFDVVREVDSVKMYCRSGEDWYTLEAAVPLDLIGLKIRQDLRVKFDWGMLVSGKDGNEVMQRVYWSNKATSIVADAPSEAKLHPNCWGHIRFHEKNQTAPDILDMGGPQFEDDDTVTDFIDSLEEEMK